jgi:hypothetical protein
VARDVSAGTRSGSSGASGEALHENSGVVASPSHRSRCAAAAPRKRYNRRSLGSPDDGADLPGTTRSARCLDAGAPRPRAHRLVPRNRRGRGTVGPNRLGRLGRNGDTGVLGRSCEQKTRRRRGQPGEQGQQRDGKPTAFPPCERLVSWHGTSPWQWRGPRRGAGHARRASLHYTCSFSVALPRVGVLRSRCPAIVTTQVTGLEEPSNLGSRVSWVSRPPSSAARWPLAEWPWEPPFPPFP